MVTLTMMVVEELEELMHLMELKRGEVQLKSIPWLRV